LSITLANIRRLYANKERVLAKEDWIHEARQVAYAHLVCLEKVYKKV